jgi:hypothetical protein
MHQGLEQRCCL